MKNEYTGLMSHPNTNKETKICKDCGAIIWSVKTKAQKKSFCTKTCSRSFYKKTMPLHLLEQEKTKTNKYLKGVRRLGKIKEGFYTGRSWQELRYDTIKKYDRKCMVCFRTGIELHVDHIKPISKFPELALEPTNLQVLCRDCNLGKGNRDSIDWRSGDVK